MVDYFTASLLILLGIVGTLLNDKLQYKFGVLIGVLIRIFMKKRRIITEQNLKLAYPEKDLSAIKLIVNESFKNLGITAIEIASMKYMSDNRILRKVIGFEGESIYDEAKASGKPMMVISSHFNNWELPGFYSSIAKNNILHMIIKKQSNERIDKEINKIRARAGTKTIDMDNAARKIISVFRSGGCVAMIVDQSALGDKGVLYPHFFNIPSATYASPAYLALKFDANMLLVVIIRHNTGKYILYCEKIQTEDLKCDDEGVSILTQRHVTALERVIRQYPAQWVWQHRRWKRMPKVAENAN